MPIKFRYIGESQTVLLLRIQRKAKIGMNNGLKLRKKVEGSFEREVCCCHIKEGC